MSRAFESLSPHRTARRGDIVAGGAFAVAGAIALFCGRAAAQAPTPPDNLVAWSGYHGSVRLNWFPSAAADGRDGRAGVTRDDLSLPPASESAAWNEPLAESAASGAIRYRIFRSDAPEGPFEMIANDLAVSWYRDDSVENGRPYSYRVSAYWESEESAPSEVATASAQAGGNRIESPLVVASPAIDGRIGAQEWSRAAVVNITAPGAASALPVIAYVMNSKTHLFVAVREPNFPFPDEFNQIGIFFDENHDGAWNAPPSRPEGSVAVIYDVNFDETWNWFRAFTGTWPFEVSSVPFGSVTSVTQSVSYVTGDAEFEVAIDLRRVPLVAREGDTIGFGLISDQTGNPPYTGDWPAGLFASSLYFKAPVLYGDLTLSGVTATPVRSDDGTETLVASPNPARDRVTFRALGAGGTQTAPGRILVFDASGRLILRLPWSPPAATWDGRDDRDRPLPAGVYFYRWEGRSAPSGRFLLVR